MLRLMAYGPDGFVEEQVEVDQVADLLDQWPVVWVNVDGLGYDEAAKVLGVPPGTIRSRMKRGRTLLQKALWIQARDAGLIRDQETKK